ncbi:hypothetical protein BH24CHL5_BH24CHL5_09620 [soil metagenome]
MDLGLIGAIGLALVGLWLALLVLLVVLRPRHVPLRELIKLVPDLVRLLRSLVSDRAVPLDVRLVVVGLLAWILSPIDLIPEFIPVLGPIDDVIVAVVALRYVRRRLGSAELRARWPGSDAGFALIERLVGRTGGPAASSGHPPPSAGGGGD